jgi:hypothetical protein
MANSTDRQRASALLLDDESLINKLKDDEAKALIDWAMSELDTTGGTLDAHVKRLHDTMSEINILVGVRQNLVSDDLEERMAALLVGDLDPRSQIRLEREREIAQVTAEKDHIEGVELVRRFTAIASRTWRAKDHAPATDHSTLTSPSPIAESAGPVMTPSASPAARARPIPRPAKIEPQKPRLLDRLLGRK